MNFDPQTGQPINNDQQKFDPQTGQPINTAQPQQNVAQPQENVAQPQENVAQPQENVAQPQQNVGNFDPQTGAPINNAQQTSGNFDPQTGAPINNGSQTDGFQQGSVGADGINPADIGNDKGMAILSYFGILALIPYLSKNTNTWVRFHAIQGLNLGIINIGIVILNSVISAFDIPFIGLLTNIASLFIWVMEIIGLVQVFQNKAEKLPIVGDIKIITK